VENVGGSEDDFVAPISDVKVKKIAIMGSSDYASFIADGMSIIGASVTQVTTSKIKPRNNAPKVSIIPPAVGDLSLGFASALGTFNCLVDTLGDESDVIEAFDDDSNDVMYEGSKGGDDKSVIGLLRKQHGCERYISTVSKSQKIILDDGLIFGRNKADKHIKSAESSSTTARHIVPPTRFGSLTLQRLLDGGIIFKNKKKDVWIQSWSLKDFWEYTSWPRDTSGNSSVRFGLPVVEESNISPDISEPLRPVSDSPTLLADEYKEKKNPYVLAIKGLDELESKILSKERNCILFLSASWCRTCKSISPQYTRMAMDMKKGESDVLIARTDAGRGSGKALGKFLNVEAVPAFVLFRDGKVYGDPLSISRLPSKKMNTAVDLLSSGQEWDREAMKALNEL